MRRAVIPAVRILLVYEKKLATAGMVTLLVVERGNSQEGKGSKLAPLECPFFASRFFGQAKK